MDISQELSKASDCPQFSKPTSVRDIAQWRSVHHGVSVDSHADPSWCVSTSTSATRAVVPTSTVTPRHVYDRKHLHALSQIVLGTSLSTVALSRVRVAANGNYPTQRHGGTVTLNRVAVN